MFFVLSLIFADLAQAQEASSCPGQKSPILSCALSWLLPSLGQYYNGQNTKGGIIDGALALGLLLNFSDGPIDPTQREIGTFIIAGSYIYSIVDAPISSEDINGEIQKRCAASKTAWAVNFNLDRTPAGRLAPFGNLVLNL
ncbi:MAG: hypothetical protein ACREL1_05305 [bacterium]